ncbi:hinge connector of long tail fiber protein distal connector [Proteus phage phiP4-3]|uniref:Long tail fiber distal connector n=1 Tax=Proteus phage phiP4-3 TaxID=2065203 RepID=A0A2I6PF70_9CAUD|nr:hinge connector of long tail fiber protein distal connector [Proteus phage phiP4-3]AUM58375.1 long tail fiber distal connector [Proteus phage phiP4-3]AZV01372.1 long tail fiber distal connector [Shigella phage vB_SdyM_006]QQV89478.1 long tail fiber distal connector [Proteus phage SJ_PmiM]
MADLKRGSTAGGELILTQGNFPLIPVGNSLYFNKHKVYTEHDKPTAEEVDSVSASKGGEFKERVIFKELQVGKQDPLIIKDHSIAGTEIILKQLEIKNLEKSLLVLNPDNPELLQVQSMKTDRLVLDTISTQPNHAVRYDQVVLVGDIIDFGEF